MEIAESIGKVKKGYFADLLLVKGDTTLEVTLFQKSNNFAMIKQRWPDAKKPTNASESI